jgi:hypothetical protein
MHGLDDRDSFLTHHSEGAQPADGVTFLSCDVAKAVQIGLEAAGGKNLEVFSPTIGRRPLERGLINEIDLHIEPVLLGDGIRLLDKPGGACPTRTAQRRGPLSRSEPAVPPRS